MKRKLSIRLAPLLAMAGFAMSPALAEAFPTLWYSNGRLIKEGQRVAVATTGTLTFSTPGVVGAGTIPCKTKDAEVIENPLGGGSGRDEVTTFTLTCKSKSDLCPKRALITASGLPWLSELVSGSPLRDALKGIVLGTNCAYGTLEGTLEPKLVGGVLEFGEGSGELSSLDGPVLVSGPDKLKGPKGDASITAVEDCGASCGAPAPSPAA
jgi:hypothetical protein